MIYLIVKMLVLLMIAAGIGVAIGWLLRGARDRQQYEAQASEDAARIAALRQERDLAESRVGAENADAERDVATVQRIAALESELSACSATTVKLEGENAALREDLANNTAAQPDAAASAPGLVAPGALMAAEPAPALVNEGAAADSADGSAPTALAQPDDGGDKLQEINGVGPKIEGLLHEMGIWRYQQIADFTRAEVAWVDERLRFKGRIDREDWIEQAKVLAGNG
ncbi:MAG: hypothetical protein ACKVH0_20255 [Alphaproteobacteria bacterium]